MKIKDLPRLYIKEEVTVNEDGTFEAKFTLEDDVHKDDRELVLTEEQCHMILDNLTTILGTIIGGINEDDNEKSRWIPVSERLPEKDTNVLAYHRNVSFDYQYVSWIDEYSGRWCGFLGNLPDDVIAWQPLPDSYKAESEDEE